MRQTVVPKGVPKGMPVPATSMLPDQPFGMGFLVDNPRPQTPTGAADVTVTPSADATAVTNSALNVFRQAWNAGPRTR